MDIQNLIRDKIVANIKIGTKGANGRPQKLSHFNVEEDKVTNSDMVEVFKQLYPGEPTKLNIMFTSENPFNFKFKRYIKDKNNNSKAVCIGNGTKAITVGQDNKGNNTQIEIECSEECKHRQNGTCKLKGSLKFVLVGIEAGGLWNLSTTGGISLSNIASEIVKYKKAGMSIANVPFELTLTEQQSLAYGTYYSIDLRRADMKPHIVNDNTNKITEGGKEEPKKLAEGIEKPENKKNEDKKEKKTTKKETTVKETENKVIETEVVEDKTKIEDKKETQKENNTNNLCVIKGFMPTVISDRKFDKIIFNDSNGQDIEYVLHPKANQNIIKAGVGAVVDIKKTAMELNRNILCEYEIKQIKDTDGTLKDYIEEELKEAV